jgi:hypothetical protein
MVQRKVLENTIFEPTKDCDMKTIYELATEAINLEISRYLTLLQVSDGFDQLSEDHLSDEKTAQLFSGGIHAVIPRDCQNIASFLVAEHRRKAAIGFDVETAVCMGVYDSIRPHAKSLYEKASELTSEFTSFDSEEIKANPFLLPVFQSVLKLSKSKLKNKVGSVSDVSISKPGSQKLASLLGEGLVPSDYLEANVLQRMEITLEGIVRDLVGRVLFEEVVANALTNEGVRFLRENEYPCIPGVVYDFRADFVLPDHLNPIAFIEVRKSSSRHASLYAKDKMFSAINWKGKHTKLIAVLIVEGEWTQATLQTMSTVFDYVIPLSKSAELARILRKAQDGDETILRWLIEFSISPSPMFSEQ